MNCGYLEWSTFCSDTVQTTLKPRTEHIEEHSNTDNKYTYLTFGDDLEGIEMP